MKFLSLLLLLASTNVLAARELVSRAVYIKDPYRVTVELYYDKETKRPDIWFEYYEASVGNKEKVEYKATSMKDHLKNADVLLKPMPITKLDNSILVIYEGFEASTGEFNVNRGMALVFHYPASSLSKETMALFAKDFPNSIAKSSETYVKAVVTRITESQVAPIAALDRDLSPELASSAQR